MSTNPVIAAYLWGRAPSSPRPNPCESNVTAYRVRQPGGGVLTLAVCGECEDDYGIPGQKCLGVVLTAHYGACEHPQHGASA